MVPGRVEAGCVVSLLVVPGIVVGGMVVPASVEVTVVLTGPELVLEELVVELLPEVVLEELEPVAALSRLLARDEASEAMLEAAALPDARADEMAPDTDEMRPPLVLDWPRASPDRRPRATRTRV